MNTGVLIVAAGAGTRFGGDAPKQYASLAGIPVLRHTVKRFAAWPGLQYVHVVIDPAHRSLYQDAVGDLPLPGAIAGGSSRRQSVLNGLERLAADKPARVFIHDGARPLIDAATLTALDAALEGCDGAIAAVKLADTLKQADGGRILATVPRQDLWRAQTPQAFHFDAILAAHRRAAREPDADSRFTDDAAVAEWAGLRVQLVSASDDNLKITNAQDLQRAARLLGSDGREEMRSGSGFDVHAFGPGDGLSLCGVKIAHDRALVGHSDADVGLHALTDALLGAIGAGDIGAHFPPTDPRWRGADSRVFLAHAASLVAQRGGRIVNVDVTLVCERPKIGPHRQAMVAAIAACLGIAAERVSVKATTTERLGFTGRGEGIAAQALATVALPIGAGGTENERRDR